MFGEDMETKLLEKEDCLSGFQLHNQDTLINFESVDASVYVVDKPFCKRLSLDLKKHEIMIIMRIMSTIPPKISMFL